MSIVEKERMLWFWLSNIKGIGPVKRRKLLEVYESPEAVFEADPKDLEKRIMGKPFRAGDLNQILSSRNIKHIEEKLASVISRGIGFWTLGDADYPMNLKRTEDAPTLLYYRGRYIQRPVTIAIVGTRQMSPYGKQAAEYLAKELSGFGIHIVSGMARGIDSTAHRSIVSSGFATTAVWGSGIDVCYPKEGNKLEADILKCGGAILSEEGPGVYPAPGLFPRRNRIISGLSDGIIVVEAKKRSGSLITADCALEQGRDVYAVPGRVFDKNSEGCNHLIRLGAKPVFDVDDVLEEYAALGKVSMGEKDDFEKLLDVNEKMVYPCIQWSPVYIDDIIRKTKLPFGKLQLILINLEMKGCIQQLPNQHYIRNG